jgi:hypothetical protein
MAEQNRDGLFDKPHPTDIEIAATKGSELVYNDIIGLANFMKRYKIPERR